MASRDTAGAPLFESLITDEQVTTLTEAGWWQNRLITDYLDAASAASPNGLAIVDGAGELTYAAFKRLVDRAALGFIDLGVEPGDTVSIQLPNRREWLIAHYAAVRVGAVTSPLIPIYRDREVSYMLRKSRAKVLVTAAEFRGFDYPEMISRLRPNLPSLEHVLVVDSNGDSPDGTRSWESFIDTPWEETVSPSEFAARRPNPNDVALLMFTSGTTGQPKGVMHTHNTLIAGALPWPDRLGMNETSVIHMASTFGHLTGYLYGVSLPIILGGTGVFQATWDVEEFLGLVERYGIEHTSGATPFLHDLISSDGLEHRDLSSLKRFCCMGAPIPRVYVERANSLLSSMSVFGGWGQTECCLATMGTPQDPTDKIVNTDGRALPGMAVRVVSQHGEAVPAGVEGDLQVRGPFLFQGYLGKLRQTRQEFDGEWFKTGDIATMDEEGYIRIAGRTKDVIIRGGENIPVAYVENVLYEHTDIRDVAVIALPHPRLQEIACAVVTLQNPDAVFELEDLKSFFNEKGVAKPYWPERVVVMDALPRTPSGKIQKFVLRQALADAAIH
ncbi:cyclohexanecarboxylate-CoA ligase [Leucobacter komagatae]|uniref:Cyclohexanecarboxylate-CoA ligase n=1 Tax=Leucobacter komagatae TaxID=55969 RepID=A0A542Y5V4_9MICO|nr:AMP-binding protein [Leucobacter komagatae]TQL43470.1 cyclohexanecarboxylate-CoA ligase [Leucobacter komagatae]